MWKRFVRALKALFGGAVSAMEDPKLILEQNIREMQDQVPKMNQNIASIKANVTLLEKQLDKYREQEADLVAKIKASISQNRDDIAASYASKLESTRSNIAQIEPQLETANRAYAKALDVKKVFMRETERKIREANDALRAHERAKMQSKVADALEQFEVGGIDQTHQEMLDRVNRKTAENEARVEMAMDSVDTSHLKIEEEAEKMRAMDLVNQFKNEMNLGGAASGSQEKDKESGSGEQNKESII